MPIRDRLTASYLCLETCKAADPKDLTCCPFLVTIWIKFVLDESAHRCRNVFRVASTPAVVVPITQNTNDNKKKKFENKNKNNTNFPASWRGIKTINRPQWWSSLLPATFIMTDSRRYYTNTRFVFSLPAGRCSLSCTLWWNTRVRNIRFLYTHPVSKTN